MTATVLQFQAHRRHAAAGGGLTETVVPPGQPSRGAASRAAADRAGVHGPSPAGARAPAVGGERPAVRARLDDALVADAVAVQVRGALDAIVVALAAAARRWVLVGGWATFGYARCDDHAVERLGRTARSIRDLAALGDGVGRLPGLQAALRGRDGPPIGRVAAILVARVATPASLAAWLDRARSSTVRELRAAVRTALREGSSWPPRPAHDGRAIPGEGSGPSPAGDDPSASPQSDTGDDAEHDRHVVVQVPAPVRAAFDETLELHRAVQAGGAEGAGGVAAFVEALVAEAAAGPRPPDLASTPLRRGVGVAECERLLARSTDGWAFLRAGVVGGFAEQDAGAADGGGRVDGEAAERAADRPDAGASVSPGCVADACGRSLRDLARLETLSRQADDGSAECTERRLRELIALEERLQCHLADVLVQMGERGMWGTLMFRGVHHYAEQRLGLGRIAIGERTRLHRALRRLPQLDRAYRRGDVGVTAALQVVRAVGDRAIDADTESAWVERAVGATVKRLRDEARVVRRELDGEGRTRRPAPLDDAAWHASLRRDPGDSRRRVVRLGLHAVEAPVSDVFLRLRLPGDLADRFSAAIEHARRTLTAEVEAVPWHQEWPDPAALPSVRAARLFSVRCRRVPAWVGLLALLEDYAITWDDPRAAGRRSAEAVYRRDGWRCAAPGCSSRRNLEEHHIEYRSRGGDNARSNRVCLCRFHHQMGEHGGLASCHGRAPLGIVWRLGTRPVATWWRNERSVRGPTSGPGRAGSLRASSSTP